MLQSYMKKMKKCLEGYEVNPVKQNLLNELRSIEIFCVDCLDTPAKILNEECSKTWFATYLQAYPVCQSVMSGIHKVSYVVKSCHLCSKIDVENILVIIKNEDQANAANGSKYFILIDSNDSYGKQKHPYIFAELGKGAHVWNEEKNVLKISGLEPVKLEIDKNKKSGLFSPSKFMVGGAQHFHGVYNNTTSTSSSNSSYNLENYKFLSRIGKKAQKEGKPGWNYFSVEIMFNDDNDLTKTLEVLKNFHDKNVDRSKSGYNL